MSVEDSKVRYHAQHVDRLVDKLRGREGGGGGGGGGREGRRRRKGKEKREEEEEGEG